MSRYKVVIKEEALEDLKKLLHSEPKVYKKAMAFIGFSRQKSMLTCCLPMGIITTSELCSHELH